MVKHNLLVRDKTLDGKEVNNQMIMNNKEKAIYKPMYTACEIALKSN